MQYLDRIGYLDYLVEQAMTRFSNIVEAGIAPVPSADYVRTELSTTPLSIAFDRTDSLLSLFLVASTGSPSFGRSF